MKVSVDGGKSWGVQRIMYRDGFNSAAVFDAVRKRVIIHFVDGAHGVMQLSCNALGQDCTTSVVGAKFLGAFNFTSPGSVWCNQTSPTLQMFALKLFFR